MATAGFPALAINTQGESPLNMLAKVTQIKSAQQSQELGGIQLQEARVQQQSREALMAAWAENGGDMNKTYAAITSGNYAGKVDPSTVMNFRVQSIAAQTQAAKLTEEQLANTGRLHDLAANELESLRALPVEQRTPERFKESLGRMLQAGGDSAASQLVPIYQSLTQNPTDANFKTVEVGLKGEQWLKANAEAANAYVPSAAENKAAYQAGIDKTIAETNAAAAKASLDTKEAALKGQVTEEDKYKRQTDLLKSVYDRQTTFTNTLYQSGLKQLDNMFTDPQHGYSQFLAQANNTKSAVMKARNGNEVAASLEPTMLALGLSSFAGVHRINPTEADAAGPGVGSLARKLQSTLDKMGTGTVPEATLKEVDSLLDGMIDSKHAAILAGANMVAANNGMNPSKVMVMGRDGSLTTLDKAGQNNPRSATPASVKVGDKVTLRNGQTITVKTVHPDGSFD